MKTTKFLALSLCTVLSVNTAKAWDPATENSISQLAGYKDLSQCEKHVINSIPTKTKAIQDAALGALTSGLTTGVFAAGMTFLGAMVLSTSQSTGATLEIFAGGTGTQWMMIDDPAKPMIIVGVTSGVVLAAISAAFLYQAYGDEVTSSLQLLQFFRDVKSGGVGPQLEAGALGIQGALKKLSLVEKIQYLGRDHLRYDPQTYDLKNIRRALREIGSSILASSLVNCQSQQRVWQIITERTMNLLIEKYNPGLTTKLNR